MRKLTIFLIALCLIVNYVITFSQCGSTINCPDKAYPYKNCSDASKLCAKNPQSESVIKLPDLPVCIDHDPADGPSTVAMGGEQGTITVFDMNDMDDDIDCAVDAWNCVCGMENAACESGCKIKVKWTKDASEFRGDASITYSRQKYVWYQSPTCEVLCDDDKTYILLNNTNEFRGGNDPKNNPNKFYCNNEVYYNYPGYLINMCDVLIKAIGTISGMEAESECPPYSYEGIMNGGVPYNSTFQGLSQDDKCAFAKLYCPGLTPVEDDFVIQEKTYNFPNPFADITSMEFSVPPGGRNVSLSIYDYQGRIVCKPLEGYYPEGRNVEKIDCTDLQNGAYYYVLIIGSKSESKSFVISK